jgi:hypothetical protein
MLRMGSWNGRDASGIATTALVAASAAAARRYRPEAARMTPPPLFDNRTNAELTLRESKSGQKLKEFVR